MIQSSHRTKEGCLIFLFTGCGRDVPEMGAWNVKISNNGSYSKKGKKKCCPKMEQH